MQRTDIYKAIEAGRVPELEEAFRDLVIWPGEATIAGVLTPEDACTLLIDVAQTLIDLKDRNVVPSEIFDVACHLRHGEELAENSYAAVAAVVLRDCLQLYAAFGRDVEVQGHPITTDEPFSAEVQKCAAQARVDARGDHEAANVVFAKLLREKPGLALEVAGVIVRSVARAQIWAANGG